MPTLIEDFISYVDGTASPALFKKWAGIALIAGLLERRVWLRTGRGISFPTLYVFLIAPPGVGKRVIEEVKGLWKDVCEPGTKIPAIRVAPDSMTRASFIDDLVAAKHTKIPPSGAPYTYHYLAISQEEWSVLFPQYDGPFLSMFNRLWNNPASHDESRRTGKQTQIRLENPSITMLAGYQPALMAMTFPEEAWASGFTRRWIMVYSGQAEQRDLFFEGGSQPGAREALLGRLSRLVAPSTYGEIKWDRAAAEAIASWDRSGPPNQGGLPVPNHPKLEYYTRSRTELVLRLCIVSAANNLRFDRITEEDVETAISWLLEVETLMPDVFRQMTGRSDVQILDELHYYVTALYAQRKGTPIPVEELMLFLAERAPSDKVPRIFDMAQKAGYVSRVAGTEGDYATFVPNVRATFRGPSA